MTRELSIWQRLFILIIARPHRLAVPRIQSDTHEVEIEAVGEILAKI